MRLFSTPTSPTVYSLEIGLFAHGLRTETLNLPLFLPEKQFSNHLPGAFLHVLQDVGVEV